MNELTKIVLSSFHPYHKAMLPNLHVPINCLTILKWMKMAGSSNYTSFPYRIQFTYIFVYTLCLSKINLQSRPLLWVLYSLIKISIYNSQNKLEFNMYKIKFMFPIHTCFLLLNVLSLWVAPSLTQARSLRVIPDSSYLLVPRTQFVTKFVT